MLKKIYFILIVSSSLLFAQYASLHQVNSPTGLINQLKQMIDGSGKPKSSYFDLGTSFIVSAEAQVKDQTWCAPSFQSYKIYIPAGLDQVTVGAVAKPNSSYKIYYLFVPDGDYEGKVLNFYEGKMIDAKVIYQKYNTKVGGWLYLNIVQASNFIYSQFGHVENPRVYLSAHYVFKKDMTEFNNWLKNTKFTSNGDPVDSFSMAYEKSRYCSNFGQNIPIYGNINGVPGSQLVPWLQTDDPVVNVSADKSSIPSSGSDISYTISYTVGDKPIDSISLNINSNTTEAVFLQDQLDECLKFEESEQLSGKDGYFVYSDNGVNWYKNAQDAAIVNNIHYVGYVYEDSNPSDGDIERVFNAKDSGKIKIVAKVTDDCTQKSSILNKAILKYTREGAEKSVEGSVSIQRTSNSGSSGGGSTGGSGGGSVGGGSSGTGGTDSGAGVSDNSYYGGNDSTSTTTGATTDTKNDAQAKQECEAAGNKWVDGTCLVQSKGTSTHKNSSKSSSSSIASSQGSKSQAQQECEAAGNKWVDGTCLLQENSSSSSSSSMSIVQEKIVNVIKKLAKKTYPVQGYFAQYGDGAFDWIYYSRNGRLYKLQGMEQGTGYLQWTPLTSYFSHVRFENGKLIIGSRTVTRDVGLRVNNVIRTIENKPFDVAGYFVHYDNGAYDWVLRTKQGLYKLNGLKDGRYFDWKPLGTYFKKIDLKNYTQLIIGDAKVEIASSSSSQQHSQSSSSIDPYLEKAKNNCQILGGQWDDENLICILNRGNSSSLVSSATGLQAKEECENAGNRWVDGTCLIQTGNHSSASRSSASSSQQTTSSGDDTSTFPSEMQ